MSTFLRFAHVYEHRPPTGVIASGQHRTLAREAAAESMVLLRNEGLLPVDPSTVTRVAVLGELASRAVLGDEGSSDVRFTPNPVTALAGLRAALPGVEVIHSTNDVSIARGVDLTVVIVGFTKHDEGEYIGAGMNETLMQLMPPVDHPMLGFEDPAQAERFGTLFERSSGVGGGAGDRGGDRDSLRLRPDHEALIEAATGVSSRVVVAVIAGSTVVMPWLEMVPAALMQWYAGSEAGHALADVVFGHAEPGGRLPS